MAQRWLGYALFLFFVKPHAAWAGDETPNRDLAVLGGLGATGGAHGRGAELGATLKFRYSFFEIGAEARTAGWFPVVTMHSLGGVAGIGLGDPWSVHLWGAGGVHSYSGVGGSLVRPIGTEDPGVSAVLPYLGGRVLFRYTAGEPRDRVRFTVGLMGLIDRDLKTVTRRSSYEVGGLERIEPHEVGQWLGGVFLVAGATFGL